MLVTKYSGVGLFLVLPSILFVISGLTPFNNQILQNFFPMWTFVLAAITGIAAFLNKIGWIYFRPAEMEMLSGVGAGLVLVGFVQVPSYMS